MKKLSLLLAAVIGATVLMASYTNEDVKMEQALTGVWELKHQTFYDNNLVTDTMFNLNGYRQVKMYSKGHVMWTRYDATDTNDWFGYGTYEVKDGMLIEYIEYGSKEMMKALDTVRQFEFRLLIDNNTFSQVALNEEGDYDFAENYNKLE